MKPVTYEVYINNHKVKEYPHKLQAIIYLIMKGYTYRCRFGCFLSSDVEIIEKENSNEKF